MDAILEARALTKRYGATLALNNVDLTLPRGKIIGLLGPNGSGKTTLLKIAAGLLTPTSGVILADNRPIGEQTKSVISFLPERTYLPDWMTVNDCLDYFEDFYSDFDRKRAVEMLTRLAVPANKRMRTLSKGTREKMQLVLVMSRRAKLYLLDEPIGGVDPATRDYILDTIIGNYDSEATILISTHLISDVEKVLDEFLFLKEGIITMHDTTDNIRETQGKSLDELFREVFRC
ncbi:MAG TPA: ABC transporter ATP-binding protein [Eubacteriales bacterium]|nr:ABC transporter ATP-binding protein [Eubacteriales bacterium]